MVIVLSLGIREVYVNSTKWNKIIVSVLLFAFFGTHLYHDGKIAFAKYNYKKRNQEITQPNKWQNSPWNNNWTSSIFISQDPVASENGALNRSVNVEHLNPGLYFVAIDELDQPAIQLIKQ